MRRKLLKNVRKITLECILAVASVTMLTACGSDAKPSDSHVTTENNQQSVIGGGSGEQTVTGSDSTGQTENADEEEAKHADIAKVVEDFLKHSELKNYEDAKNTWFSAAWEYNDKYVYVNNNDEEIVDIL